MEAANRIKVHAVGGGPSSPFTLQAPVASFQSFAPGPAKYCVLAATGEWQISFGDASGNNLTRGILEENHLGTTDEIDFTGLTIQIAKILSNADIVDAGMRLEALEQSGGIKAIGAKVEDKGEWLPGHYDLNDQVSLQGYLMRCTNVDGTDAYPIPQAVAGPYSYFSKILNASSLPIQPPVFTKVDGGAEVVRSGLGYRFTKGLKVLEISVRVPEVTANTSYKLVIVLNPNATYPDKVEHPISNLPEDVWTTIFVINANYPVGQELLIYLEAYTNTGATLYLEEADYFAGTSHEGEIQGFLQIGNNPPTLSNNVYGIDLVVQDISESDDWQVRASGATKSTSTVNREAGVIYFQATAPTAALEGDFWIQQGSNEFFRYTAGTWESVQDITISAAMAAAMDAQALADGKIVTFAQDNAPVSPPTIIGIGDLWMDTDANNNIYRWNGAVWVYYAQDSADWSKIFGPGKPADNADVTADNIAKEIFNQGGLAVEDLVTNLLIADGAVTAAKTSIAALNAATGALATNAVTTGSILDGAISAAKTDIAAINASTGLLALNSIPSDAILDGAITAAKTAIAAIDPVSGNIGANSVVANSIQAGAITSVKITAGAITAGKIAANAVVANNIAAGAITANKIAANSITSVQIKTRSIVAGDIASGSITSNEIKAGTITANKIAAGTITAQQIYTGGITSKQIQASQIHVLTLSALTANLGQVSAGNVDTSGYLVARGGAPVPGQPGRAAMVANSSYTQNYGVAGFAPSSPANSHNSGVIGIANSSATGVFGLSGSGVGVLAVSKSGYALRVQGKMQITNKDVVYNLNSEFLQGASPGNAQGQIPLSNGIECVNLNAAKLGGYVSTKFLGAMSCDHGVAVVGSSTLRFKSTISGFRTRGSGSTVYIESSGSDRRLKKEIKAEELGLDFITKLKPVSFKYNEGKDEIVHGFIAQEIQELLGLSPGADSLVGQNEHTGMLDVSYLSIIAPLVKAVQELTKEVEALKGAK